MASRGWCLRQEDTCGGWFVFEGDRIAAIEIIGDPVRLRTFELSLLGADESPTPG